MVGRPALITTGWEGSKNVGAKIFRDCSGGFFNNPLLDDDGVFRRVPLLQAYENELHESLSLALTRVATGSPIIEMVVETNEDSDDLFLEWITIGEIAIPVDQVNVIFGIK